MGRNFAVVPPSPSQPAIRGIDPRKVPTLAAAMPEQVDSLNRSDAFAAREAERQQREQEAALKEQQREAEKARAAAEREAKIAKNSAAEADLMGRGVVQYTDARGDIQPVRDPETGNEVFRPKVTKPKWDEQGRAFVIERDETGATRQKFLDASAPIGRNPNDPNDPALYRQNKHSKWDRIDPAEAIGSDDPTLRGAAASHLKQMEAENLKRELQKLNIADDEASATVGRPSKKDLEDAGFDLSSEDPTVKARAQAVIDADKQFRDRAKQKADLGRKMLELDALDNERFSERFRASVPGRLQAEKKDALMRQRESLQQEADALGSEMESFNQESQKPKTAEESATLQSRFISLNEKQAEIQARQDSHNQEAQRFADWEQRRQSDAMESQTMGLKAWDSDAKAMQPAEAKQQKPLKTVEELSGPVRPGGLRALSFRNDGIELRDGIERLPEILDHPELATQDIYLFPGADDIGAIRANRPAGIERINQARKAIDSRVDEQSKAAKEWIEGKGAEMIQGGQPVSGVENAFAAHMKEWGKQNRQRLLTEAKELSDLQKLTFTGIIPVNQLVSAWKAAGRDARIAPTVTEVLDAAGDKNAQDVGTQKKRSEALDAYIREFRGTPLFNEEEVARMAEKQGKQLLRESLNENQGWLSAAGGTLRNTMATMGKGLEASRAVWNYLTGDVEEALTLKDEIEQVDRGLNLNELQTAWSVDNQFGGNFRSFRDYANWLSRVGVEAVPQMLPTIAMAGAGSMLGQVGGKFFANLGVKGATAELVAKGMSEKVARTAIQKGLLSEAAAGSAGTITKMVQKAAIDRAGAIGMKGGAFLGSLQQNGGELLSNTLAQFTAQDMRERPNDVKRALAGALMLSVPAAALDLMDGNEKALYMAALKEPAKRFHARAGKAMLGAVKEFGLASLKEGGTGFGQSIIGVLNSRQTKGEQMDAPLTKAEVDEIIEGTFAEAAGGGVMHVSTGSIAKAKQLFQSWRAGKSAEIEASKANEAIAAADKNPEVAALIGSVAKNGDVQAFDREIQAATEAYDKAVKSGDSDTALQIRVSLPLLHKAKAQAAAQLVETATQATAELNAAQAKAEQAIASDPNIQEDSPLFAQLEAVKQARAVARIATGADVATLPDSELRAVGYERGPDGGPKPIKGVVPAVTPAPGGGWVITDEAIKAAEAVSPAARALVKLDERTARIRAAVRMQAAESSPSENAPTAKPEPVAPEPAPSNLSKFSVTVESPSGKESVIEVEATDSKAASADVAGRGIGMVRDVQQVSGPAARSPIEEALKSFGEGALTATAARVREGKDMTVRRADAIAALRVSPVHTIEDNADGSVRITGVLDPVTKQWVGKAPSPASPQVAPAPAAQTRQQQREAAKAIRAEKDRLEQEFLDKWGLPPLEGDATYEQWKAERVALNEKIKRLSEEAPTAPAAIITPGETIAPGSIDAAAGTPVETKIKALAGNTWDAQGIGDIMSQPQYSAPAIPGLLDARMDAQTLGGRVNLVFEGRAAAEAFMRRIPQGLTYGINDAGGISVVNVRDVAGGTTLTEQALKLSPISTASPAPAPASPIEEALKSFGEGALAATAARVREGKDMTVRRADAIAALRVSPVHTIEDNADGSVRITGVLDPVTKQWVGKAPSPASPQVAPAPAAPTRQQQREAGSAHETKQDRTTIEKAVGQTIGDDLGKIAGDSYEAVKAVFPGGVVVNDGDAGGGVSVEEKDGKITLVVSKKALKAQQDGVGDGMGKWIQAAIVEEAIHAVALSLEKSGKLDATSIWKSLPKVVRDHVVRVYGNASDRNLGHEFLRMVIQNRIAINGTKLEVTGDAGISEELAPKTLKKLWKALNAIRKYLVDLVGSLTEAGADKATVKAIKKKADEIEAMLLEMTGAKEPATPAPVPAKIVPVGTVREDNTYESENADRTKRLRFKLALIDLSTTSNSRGTKYQPRERSRVESQAQIVELANSWSPEKALPATSIEHGPIVTTDGKIRSGHGRESALREIYSNDAYAQTAEENRAFLKAYFTQQGMTKEAAAVDKMAMPALAAEIVDFGDYASESDPLLSYVRDANPDEMSRVEESIKNAGALRQSPALVDRLELDANGDFIEDGDAGQAVLAIIEALGLRNKLTRDGRATPELYDTVRQSLLAYVLGADTESGRRSGMEVTLTQLVEDSGDNRTVNFTKALVRSAATLAKIQNVKPEFFTDSLAPAVQKFVAWKQEGGKGRFSEYLEQGDMFAEPTPEDVLRIGRALDSANGPRVLSAVLDSIAEDAAYGGVDLFAAMNAPVTEPIVETVVPAAEPIRETIKKARKATSKAPKTVKAKARKVVEKQIEESKAVPEEDKATLKQEAEQIAPDGSAGRQKTIQAFEGLFSKRLDPLQGGFYSQLARVVAVKMPGRASADQLIGIVFNPQNGIKPEEVKWSGLIPWAKSQPQPLSRDAVVQYLANEGAVRFEEVQYGAIEEPQKALQALIDEYTEQLDQLGYEVIWQHEVIWQDSGETNSRELIGIEMMSSGRRYTEMDSWGDAEAESILARLSSAHGQLNGHMFLFGDPTPLTTGPAPEYSQYQLPGGKNYREVVLSMQRKFTSDQQKTPKQLAKEMFGADSIYDLTAEQQRQLMARNEVKDRPYTSSHFPDVPNYVAHMRLNERKDAEGKAGLFIEEIQSDRHQAGRQKGYAGDNQTAGWTAVVGSKGVNADIYTVYDQGGNRVSSAIASSAEEAIQNAAKETARQGVPDAPFRTTWPLSLFKRALRDAVAAGKQWIGWTDGAEQAGRYENDMRAKIDQITWQTTGGKKSVKAMKNGNIFFGGNVDTEGNIRGSGTEADGKPVGDVFGKSMAEKIAAADKGVLEGAGLTIGGEGMKGFYDNILPKEVGKYVKQWGAGVVKGKILADATPIWRVDITPEMADSVSKGQPLFSRRLEKEDTDYLAAVESGDMEAAQRMVDEAAKAAGYNVGPVYHGTNAKITAFDKSKVGKNERKSNPLTNGRGMFGDGFYFAPIKDEAANYGKRVMSVFLKYDNPLILSDPFALDNGRARAAWEESLDPGYAEYVKSKGGSLDSEWGTKRRLWHDAKSPFGAEYARRDLAGKAEQFGFDAILADKRVEGDSGSEALFGEVVVFNPSQIKSADPVTRDEQGNVIPLSKRFDSGSDSILYSKPLVTYRKALPNDKERRAKMIDAAETLIAEGVKTPDGLAEVLDGISKSLREYSQTFWSFFTQLDETLEYVPDWQAVYDKRDGVAEPLALENQTDASVEADRAKSEAAAKKKQQQQAIDAAAAAPLTGKDTTGQGALFADDPANDLFSGPSAEQIFNNPEANTSPETVQATTEPNASNEEGQKEGRQALLNNGGVASAASPTPTSSGLSDFGEKLGGARKDKAAKRVITDADYEKMSLSEIWPKSEVDSIEDTALASLAHSIRDSIPTKPQKGYKVKSWAENVKTVLGLVDVAMEKGFDFVIQQMASNRVLSGLAAKAQILQQLPRAQWSRIGNVEWWPDAYSFKTDESGKTVTGEDGKAIRVLSPFGSIEIDKGRFRGKSVEELEAKAKEFLEGAKTERKMEFEVRGREGVGYYINKKGDALHRKLKSFDNSQDALKFARAPENYDELAAAWDGIKETDNVKETDVRRAENRPRRGDDYRKGEDATPEMFMSTFGFRGVEFGNWVSQGKNAKERQGMLNAAYDALMDLASITGFPARAISLDGSLGLGLGSRGSGWASAHYEPRLIVINLTKTRGAGSLAHEWFHALDNYFQRQRNATGIAYGEGDYITKEPENYYQDSRGYRISEARFNQVRLKKENWKLVEGVRPEVAAGFAALVKTLDASPMAKRASLLDKGKTKYWSDIIERAARSFENFIIARMMQDGYHNDYLANVVSVEDFARDAGRYPYLLADEIQPVKEAFESLLGAIKTKETDKGLALYSARINPPNLRAALKAREKLRAITDPSPSQRESLRRVEEVILREERKLGQAMMFRDEEVIPSRPLQTAKFEQMALFSKSLRESVGDNAAGLGQSRGMSNAPGAAQQQGSTPPGGSVKMWRAGNTVGKNGFTFFASSEDYAANYGTPDAYDVVPGKVLDLTQWKADEDVSGADFLDALADSGVDISGIQPIDGEPLQQLSQRHHDPDGELARRIGAAGFDSVRINEYVYGSGKDVTLAVLNPDNATLSEEGGLEQSPAPSDGAKFEQMALFSKSLRESGGKVTPTQDAEYMAAAESGDMETAQRMVDAAAKNGTKIRRLVDQKTNTPLGDTYKVIAEGFLYRTVSQRDYDRIEENGRIDSDQRGAVSSSEGVNLANNPISSITYAPLGDDAVLLTIDASGINLHGYEFDQYVRAWDSIPFDKIVSAEKFVGGESMPSSLKPVTRDEQGIIPLSQRFDSSNDSILYAKSFRKELEDAGMDIGILDAATDRARQEKPGQRTVGRPDLALGALDPVIMGVDETRIVEEQTFEQWDAEARRMLRADYEGTVKRIQEIGRSGMELDPALTRAVQMIVARESRKKMNPAQQRRLQWLVYSYRNSRTQTARALAAGRDPFMTPEDRHREFLMKIIFTPTKEVRDRLEMAEGIEEKERIMKEQRDELERIKKELARLGISLDDIFSGSVSLVLKNDPIVAKLTASLDAKQRGVVPLLQKGMAFKDIAKATGLREDAVTALHTDLRAKAKAKVLARLRVMLDSAKSALKSARINDDGGAIVDAAALAGMSDAEAEAAMQQIAEQMVQQMGFLPVEKQGKMKPSRRKARKPIFQVHPRRESAPAGESIQPGEGRTKGEELDLGNTEGMTEDQIKRLTRPVERTKPGTQPRIEGLSPAADESITGDAEEWSTKGLFPEAWDAWDGEQLVPVGADLTDIADVVSVARAAQIARASKLDMLNEWWINNLLSGPTTHVRNLVGNVASLTLSKTFVRGIETLLRGQPKEMVHLWKGLAPGIARGWKLAKMAWANQADFTKSDFLNAQIEFEGLVKGEGSTAAIPGKLGDIVRIPGRLLAFSDSLFKGIIAQMEAGAQAFRIAKSQGLSGNELVKKMHSELNTPGSMSWQLALEKADEATFQQKLRKMDAHKNYGAAYAKAGAEGLTGEARKLRAKILMGAPPSGPIIGYAARALEEGAVRLSNFANAVTLLKFIVPFISTPYNILRTGIRMSPVGGVVLAEELLSGGWIKWRRGKAMTETHPLMIQHAAEQIIGWTAALLLAGAVEGDDDDEDQWLLITGTRQKGAQADLQARSYPATSIRIFGKWFNYGSIEPIATTIGVIADAVRAKKTGSGSLISSLRGQIDGKTFLKGLADTWDNVERMAEGKTDIKAESIKFALTALVPNLIRQPLRASDDLERDWKAKEWWHDALPYGGGAAPKIDATTGEPVKKPGNFATRLLFPFLVAPPEQIAASDRMLIEWNRQNPNSRWAPDEASRILDVKQPGGGKVRVELNGKAYEYLQKRAAAVTKLRLPSYRPNPDERTIKAIKDAYEEGRTKAREELRRWSLEKLGTVK